MNWFVFSNRLICRVFESLSVSSLCEPEFESSVTGFESEILGRVYMVVLVHSHTERERLTHTYIIIQRKRGITIHVYTHRMHIHNTHFHIHTYTPTHAHIHSHAQHTQPTYIDREKREIIYTEIERERE